MEKAAPNPIVEIDAYSATMVRFHRTIVAEYARGGKEKIGGGLSRKKKSPS